MDNFFKVKRALVRKIPNSLTLGLSQEVPREPINVARAQEQHHNYITLLKKLGLSVTELPAMENLPDCCFVEDTAVIIGDLAAISCLGAKERLGEEDSIREALQDLGLKIIDIKSPGTLDGGDVLYTGTHLFVGLSTRTNLSGAEQLAKIFPGIPVITVPVTGALHLKSVLSALNEKILLFSDSVAAKNILSYLETTINIRASYTILTVPDASAANVLSVNSFIVMQDGFPQTEELLTKIAAEINMTLVKVRMSELFKVDGALTCCSLLF